MNSTIRSITLAAVAVSGTSLALADAPEVQVYGRAHVSVDMLDNGEDSGMNVSSNSSRLGFRASTEIADGLKGKIQIEQEIRFENGGASTLASRDSFVGLEGGFGGVRLGFFDTPLKKVRGEVDFFGDQIGDARNLTRLNQGPLSQDFDTRFQNGIHYYTPSFGGFKIDVHYSTNTTTSTNPPDDENAGLSTSLTYKAGDLYVGFAYETSETRNDSNAMRVGAKYKIGDLTLAGLFQQATAEPVTGDGVDVTTTGFGASYKVASKTTIKGQVYALSSDLDESDATMVAFGVDHSLNKQFRLLFAYAQTDNDEMSNYRMSGGGHGAQVTPIVGETASGFSAGARYDF